MTVISRGNNSQDGMSAMGQKQTSKRLNPMFALPPIADIAEGDRHVRFVPKSGHRITHSIACRRALVTSWPLGSRVQSVCPAGVFGATLAFVRPFRR